jgi:hypothetical protein
LFPLLVALGLLTAGLLSLAAPAFARTTSTTNHQKGLVETFVDVLPSCDDSPLYEITTTSNLVEHVTMLDNGSSHETFTQTGTFSAAPLDPSLASYTGKFTVWGNFNQTGTTANGTFTFNVQGMGSDGSTLSNHSNEHFNERPDGSVNEFFHCH